MVLHADRLEGLFSKSDFMALFEKLVIRWHLTARQIIVAAPFVGHPYLSREKKWTPGWIQPVNTTLSICC